MDQETQEILARFEQELRLRGRSEATIKHYGIHIRLFLKHAGRDPRGISAGDIKEYISFLYGRKFALNTIKLKVRSLIQFYRYLFEKGMILINPVESIREPSGRRRELPSNLLSVSDMKAIRELMPERTLLNLRDKAIIEVLYATGLRLKELSGLDISDIDLSAKQVFIRSGKGNRDRQAVLTVEAVTALWNYLQSRREIPDERAGLWINCRGERLSRQMIYKIIKRSAERAGIASAHSPHAWRHGLATTLLRNGASIRLIQEFLGHVSIRTTQIYTHLRISDLQKIHARTHPREQDPIPSEMMNLFTRRASHGDQASASHGNQASAPHGNQAFALHGDQNSRGGVF
ncbi:MAG: hypothetical protein DSY80_09305 [Desulfocapsa sp.]|nr:MAG: hypothetical protein DSY80_09305 [Desulfocapsa sp.]